MRSGFNRIVQKKTGLWQLIKSPIGQGQIRGIAINPSLQFMQISVKFECNIFRKKWVRQPEDRTLSGLPNPMGLCNQSSALPVAEPDWNGFGNQGVRAMVLVAEPDQTGWHRTPGEISARFKSNFK